MASGKDFWRFRAAADSADAGELLLYGEIGGWWGEIQADRFVRDIRAYDGRRLKVYINSYGGDVFTAAAIYSQLKRREGGTTVVIDGIAASAASYIAMAGETVIMPENAMLMIHNPWTMAAGDAEAFRKEADTLDRVRDSLIAAYSEKTGMDADALKALLDDETWMTASQAVELGFADKIEESRSVAASLAAGRCSVNGMVFDASRFKSFPAALFASGANPGPSAAPATRSEDMDVKELLALLGVKDTDAAGRKIQELQAQADDGAEMRRKLAEAEAERDRAVAQLADERSAREKNELQAMYDCAVSEGRLLASSKQAELYRRWLESPEHHAALRESLSAAMENAPIVPLQRQTPGGAAPTPPEAKGAKQGVAQMTPEEFISCLPVDTQARVKNGPTLANLHALWQHPRQRAKLAQETGLQIPEAWPWGDVRASFRDFAAEKVKAL